MNKLYSLALAAVLALGSPLAAANSFHPDFPLLNKEGGPWQAGDNISEAETCGQCHNSELIHQSLDKLHNREIPHNERLKLKLGLLQESDLSTPASGNCLTCHSQENKNLSLLLNSKDLVRAEALTLSSPDSETCGTCHNHVITADNTPLTLPDLNDDQNLFGLTGEIFAAQSIEHSALNIANKQALTRSFDAHAQRLVGCTDCHSSPNNPVRPQHGNAKGLRFDPRRLSAHEYLQQTDHGFAEALACEDCHQVKSSHNWLPYLNQHLSKLSCQSCHTPWIPSPAYESLSVQGEQNNLHWRGISDGFITGYQPWLLPNEQGQLTPFNIIKVNNNALVTGFAAAIHHSISSEQAIKECRACHDKDSVLLRALPARPANLALPENLLDDTLQPRLEKAGIYLIGGNTVPMVDLLGLLLLLGTIATVSAHGIARYLAARKNGPPTAERKRIYIYAYYERLWHWLQAAAVMALLATGAAIHKPWLFPWLDFSLMVHTHNILGFVLFFNAALALFYHLASGEIKQYIPMPSDLFVRSFQQIQFYLRGIFTNQPHPFEKDREHKLNPLQKIAYFGLLNVLLPAQMFTGLLMWGAQTWPQWADAFGGLPLLGPLHSLLAWAFASFLVMHIYLTTTSGPKPLSGIKSMIDGWEDVEVHNKGD